MKLIQEKTNSQSGRSMVEMLGVLAIIGVLSVGGIAGYKTAMDMYKKNQLREIINAFEFSVAEADNKDFCTPYDQPNSSLVAFQKATEYLCQFLSNKCSSFDTTKENESYGGVTYNGVSFYVMTIPNSGDLFLTIELDCSTAKEIPGTYCASSRTLYSIPFDYLDCE